MKVDDITDKIGDSISINNELFEYVRFNVNLNQFVVFESKKYLIYAHLDCSEVYVYVHKNFKFDYFGQDQYLHKVNSYLEFCKVVSDLANKIIQTYESELN